MSGLPQKTLALSIVSHGNREPVARLLADLARLGRTDLDVILTLNLPEALPDGFDALPFGVTLIRNAQPKGFAANHNAAFAVSRGEYFVLLNPDIRLRDDPFDVLLSLFAAAPDSICAPQVVNDAGEIEDSARKFPTPFLLLKKVAAKLFGFSLARDVVAVQDEVLRPDWVAGMFVMLPRAVYEKLRGLNERYHLYYEDVDLCARARLAGYPILVSRRASVIHQAQRDSHRKPRYLWWHLRSACRFFCSAPYLTIQMRRLAGRT